MTTAHDLISEPLLSWRDQALRFRRATLPGLLSHLASGELVDFPRVRAHQFHPWCMFLTQLAAIALHRAGASKPRLSEDEWRAHLLSLTDGAREPWSLVVDDLTKAAFLQPPVPATTTEEWSWTAYPDDLDVLVTSKNHDVKTSTIVAEAVEAWVYSIVSLQTMQGYPGRGYNRIARMKGGYGSRPRVGLAATDRLTDRFIRDVDVLLDSWPSLIARGFTDDGSALTWLKPWDGSSSLAMPALSPHFVEVCWRVRFGLKASRMVAAYTTTTARRCLPEIENGDVGDPWIPIEREEGALTVGKQGFHYELLSRFLFGGDFQPAAAQTVRNTDTREVLCIASAMARGQGKTEGLHGRRILLRGAIRQRLGDPNGVSVVGDRAARNVQRAKRMRSNVLFPALKRLSLGDEVPHDSFDKRVDELFFDHLFTFIEKDDDDADLAWDRILRDVALDELERAIDRCTLPSARWYRAVSEAGAILRSRLRKEFPTLEASSRMPGADAGL